MTEEEKKITLIAETVAEKMLGQKPAWFHAHEKSDEKEFGNINETLSDQNVTLDELKKAQDKLMAHQLKYHEASEPMLEWFNTMTAGKMIKLNFLKATGLWTGVITGMAAVLIIIWAVFKFIVFNAITIK